MKDKKILPLIILILATTYLVLNILFDFRGTTFSLIFSGGEVQLY